MVVVLKINRKQVVPPIRGVCGGECHEVQVEIGTECPGVGLHNVNGYCSFLPY